MVATPGTPADQHPETLDAIHADPTDALQPETLLVALPDALLPDTALPTTDLDLLLVDALHDAADLDHPNTPAQPDLPPALIAALLTDALLPHQHANRILNLQAL